MGFATRILAGDCEEAAVQALARIARVEVRGRDANLGWTYSLALQSILCQGRWEKARAFLERWERNGSAGGQIASLRPRIDLAEGKPAPYVVRRILEGLDAEGTTTHARTELLRVLARVGQDVKGLAPWIAEAKAGALDLDATPGARRAYLRAKRALELRAELLTAPSDAVLERYRRLLRPWAEVNAEWQLGDQVEALVLYAEALEHVGRDARRVWQKVAELGYPRLWMSDLWHLARERSE